MVYLTYDSVPYLMRQDDAEGETILRKEGKESYVVVRDARGFLAEILVDNPRGDGRTTNLPFTDIIVPRTDEVTAAMRDEGSVWAVGLRTIGFEELRAEHRRFGHIDHWFPNDDEVAGPHKYCMRVIDEWGGLDLDYPLRSRNQSVEGFKKHIDFVESFGGVQFQKEGPKAVAARIRCDDVPEF
uniref:Uncharacterized protein n=1 Tax=Chromera velia CCMP2878 TaxID=1169474 RepID=A0A0G4HU14_9ALVE|eukprot:Cvel_8578.t1-p1 / transcript=Cvel_8578.t1 / gene=Cvel_8578 / organism=Chromera_velia_CCMP2878 / gene_product=hypothetical protein / transcript_product=hypothetical protein / location=Cvel_scaffold476:21056-21784(-) / protein_length=183 / sequence_SO=supercontig / SO=protein_coding / is_pseudo=false